MRADEALVSKDLVFNIYYVESQPLDEVVDIDISVILAHRTTLLAAAEGVLIVARCAWGYVDKIYVQFRIAVPAIGN